MTGVRAGAGGSGVRAGAGGSGVASGPATFDPVSALGWLHAYWTEGDAFQALALADAGSVTDWPDEIGSLDATNGSSTATFDAENATFNGKPTIHFPGGSTNSKLQTAEESLTAGPWSVVVVAKVDSGQSTSAHILDGVSDGTPRFYVQPSTSDWRVGNVTSATGPLYTAKPVTDLHLHAVRFGPVVRYDIDGDTGLAQASYTPAGFGGLTVMSRYTSTGQIVGDIAFIGIYAGDVFADPDWPAFEAALAAHYGITVPDVPTADAATVLADAWGHWDASDTDSITVTSGAADQIDDQTGNGHHFVGSGGTRPATGTRTYNGLNVLDCANDVMTTAATGLGITEFTVVAAILRDSGSAVGVFTLHSAAANDYDNTDSGEVMAVNATQIISDVHDGNTTLTIGGTAHGAYAIRKDGTGAGSLTLHALGGQGARVTPTSADSTGSGTPTTVALAARRIGSAYASNFDGAFMEGAIWDRALTDDELAAIGEYLGAKWGFGA